MSQRAIRGVDALRRDAWRFRLSKMTRCANEVCVTDHRMKTAAFT
jgi:hypothetical protein